MQYEMLYGGVKRWCNRNAIECASLIVLTLNIDLTLFSPGFTEGEPGSIVDIIPKSDGVQVIYGLV